MTIIFYICHMKRKTTRDMKKILFIIMMTVAAIAATAQVPLEYSSDYATGYIDGANGTSVKFSEKYISVDGVLYSTYSENSDTWTLVRYPSSRPGTTYTVSDNCYRIARGAFQGARNLQVINIPSQVRYIGDNAFEGCTALTAINYGDNASAIEAPTIENIAEERQEIARFNLAGQPCSPDEKGLQIIVYSDNTASTVIVN